MVQWIFLTTLLSPLRLQQTPTSHTPPVPLQAALDTTGREDLLQHLRQMLLLQQGRELRCQKIVLGATSSSIAVQIIAETAKVGRVGDLLPSSPGSTIYVIPIVKG